MRLRTAGDLRLVSSIVLLLTACAPAHSANLPPNPIDPISPGDHLRVTHNSQCCTSPSIGFEQSLSRDTLVMQRVAGSPPFAIPRSSIIRIERWNRGQRHLAAGAVLGFLAGALSGALIGFSTSCSHCDGDWRPLGAIAGVILGGPSGLAVGMLFGAQRHGFWEPVP